jgi:putative polyhydroxyalkanoate system protein
VSALQDEPPVRALAATEVRVSKLHITQSHNLSLDDAREKLAAFEATMGKYGVNASWSGNKAALKGMAVSGNILVGADLIEITLKLGMMARAAGVDPVRLKASIEKRLKASFEAEQ